MQPASPVDMVCAKIKRVAAEERALFCDGEKSMVTRGRTRGHVCRNEGLPILKNADVVEKKNKDRGDEDGVLIVLEM